MSYSHKELKHVQCNQYIEEKKNCIQATIHTQNLPILFVDYFISSEYDEDMPFICFSLYLLK